MICRYYLEYLLQKKVYISISTVFKNPTIVFTFNDRVKFSFYAFYSFEGITWYVV